MKKLAYMAILVVLFIRGAETAYADESALRVLSYYPIDTVQFTYMDFPFSADIGFRSEPRIGIEEDLIIRFTPMRDIDDSLVFYLRVLPDAFVDLEKTEFAWAYPDSGSSFQEMVGMTFHRGGNYTVSIAQRDLAGKPFALHELVVSFGVNGDLIWMGKKPSAVSACPGTFATRDMTSYSFSKDQSGAITPNRVVDPFDIHIWLDSMPRFDAWNTARFEVVANKKFMRDVQFQVIHHPLTKVQNLSDSWDIKTERGDRYEGRFEFSHNYKGLSFITFQVFARDFRTKLSGRAESELSFFMAWDADGNLVYLGDANICDCRISLDDPIYPDFASVLGFTGSTYRTKSVRSQPDFEKIVQEQASEADSSKVDQAKLDSLMNTLKRK